MYVTPSSVMETTNLRGNHHASQKKMDHMQQNYLKTSMKDDDHHLPNNNPFVDPSSHGFMQDFHNNNDHHFRHVNGSSSNNPNLGVQNANIDPFGNLTCGCSQGNLDVYECKHFVENDGTNNGVRDANVMDNFQYEGYNNSLNLTRQNQMDHHHHHHHMMVANNQSYLPFNPLETKPLNFAVQGEISCISPSNYYKRDGMEIKDDNNKESPITRRTFKARKKSNMVKGQWTFEEDRLLIQLVEQYGVTKWAHIAQALPGRIGKQCRERWHNHLRPDIKKDIWTEEEDKILIQSHSELGNKWAEIAKRLAGRTENSIKNHWNATKRRQYSKRKCRSKYPRGTLLQEYIKSLNLDQNPPTDYRKRSSANTNKSMAHSTSTSKALASSSASASNSNDRLVPSYDFNEVPELCFDDNLFIQEGCGIDSLLDDVPCAPTIMDEKDFNGKMMVQCGPVVAPILGVEVKKEGAAGFD